MEWGLPHLHPSQPLWCQGVWNKWSQNKTTPNSSFLWNCQDTETSLGKHRNVWLFTMASFRAGYVGAAWLQQDLVSWKSSNPLRGDSPRCFRAGAGFTQTVPGVPFKAKDLSHRGENCGRWTIRYRRSCFGQMLLSLFNVNWVFVHGSNQASPERLTKIALSCFVPVT